MLWTGVVKAIMAPQMASKTTERAKLLMAHFLFELKTKAAVPPLLGARSAALRASDQIIGVWLMGCGRH
ncbi:hypothetical protein [Amantichitinum ursilacus]|uniref:hypothetical protein n=1 Tax=Amantichitinum ursilacus TaxID=857265 RepID=UPI0006B63BB8|nr:hypothetical protein [Amantichitinum ursilacus]